MEYRPFPKYVAGPGQTFRVVQTPAELAQAHAEGFGVPAEPTKRKPGRPKKSIALDRGAQE